MYRKGSSFRNENQGEIERSRLEPEKCGCLTPLFSGLFLARGPKAFLFNGFFLLYAHSMHGEKYEI